jgi:hypothetical protein
MELSQCGVSERGVSHVFLSLDFGGRCACGRKVAVADESGGLDIRTALPPMPRGESFRQQFLGFLRTRAPRTSLDPPAGGSSPARPV